MTLFFPLFKCLKRPLISQRQVKRLDYTKNKKTLDYLELKPDKNPLFNGANA